MLGGWPRCPRSTPTPPCCSTATAATPPDRSGRRLPTPPAPAPPATGLLEGDGDATAGRLGQSAADVDVVIDYLWGEPAAAAMIAILTSRADRSKPLTWIQIGSRAGRS